MGRVQGLLVVAGGIVTLLSIAAAGLQIYVSDEKRLARLKNDLADWWYATAASNWAVLSVSAAEKTEGFLGRIFGSRLMSLRGMLVLLCIDLILNVVALAAMPELVDDKSLSAFVADGIRNGDIGWWTLLWVAGWFGSNFAVDLSALMVSRSYLGAVARRTRSRPWVDLCVSGGIAYVSYAVALTLTMILRGLGDDSPSAIPDGLTWSWLRLPITMAYNAFASAPEGGIGSLFVALGRFALLAASPALFSACLFFLLFAVVLFATATRRVLQPRVTDGLDWMSSHLNGPFLALLAFVFGSLAALTYFIK